MSQTSESTEIHLGQLQFDMTLPLLAETRVKELLARLNSTRGIVAYDDTNVGDRETTIVVQIHDDHLRLVRILRTKCHHIASSIVDGLI